MRHVAQRVSQPPHDDLLGVRFPAAQATLELIAARRHDKDADRIGATLTHLLRALPVDLEQNRAPVVDERLNVSFARTIPVIEDFGGLEKCVMVAHRAKLTLAHEEIVLAMNLLLALRARRVGDRKFDSGLALQQLVHERRLAGTRGCG